jgi:hypothetical protein
MTPELSGSPDVEADMNRIILALGLAAALVLPASAAAKPDKADRTAAKAECKDERGKTTATRAAFRTKYRGFRDCVRQTAAEEEAEEETAHKNAAQECREERSDDRDAFQENYGTNANKRNAFGRCVSGKARENEAEMDAEDAEDAAEFKNAAKECAAEREDGRDEFADRYGTNENNKNAFGKCVSGKTRES